MAVIAHSARISSQPDTVHERLSSGSQNPGRRRHGVMNLLVQELGLVTLVEWGLWSSSMSTAQLGRTSKPEKTCRYEFLVPLHLMELGLIPGLSR
jgi:hypothetical protein